MNKNEELKKAQRLNEIVQSKGWDDVVVLLNSLSQRMYPNPKDKKYKYFPWESIEKDYTYARGGTEVVKDFISLMSQQAEIVENLSKEVEKDVRDGNPKRGDTNRLWGKILSGK